MRSKFLLWRPTVSLTGAAYYSVDCSGVNPVLTYSRSPALCHVVKTSCSASVGGNLQSWGERRTLCLHACILSLHVVCVPI